MDGHDDSRTDTLLLPFIRANDAVSDEHLSDLIAAQTESTIKGIIRSRLRVSLLATDGSHNNQEALDLMADVQASLIAGLRRLKDAERSGTIANLHSYVAAVTFNACHQFLRRKYPQRLRLKNQIRYVLTHERTLALWETGDHQWLCGLAAWRGRAAPTVATSLAIGDAIAGVIAQPPGGGLRHGGLAERLVAIFHRVNGPVALEDLVSGMAEALGVSDRVAARDRSSPEEAGRTEGPAHAVAPRVQTELEQRAELEVLWSAICGLPRRHRAALLLNLRDKGGGDALALLPVTGIATIDEIARAVGFEPDAFARVWNDLPWDDLTIARYLGLSRQQVINLRQSARVRLARETRTV